MCRFNLHKGYVAFSFFFKHCLLKQIKVETKERITIEANELGQVATAPINFYPGNKLFLLACCLNRCLNCPSRLYLLFYTFKRALTLSTQTEGCFNGFNLHKAFSWSRCPVWPSSFNEGRDLD